MGFTLHLIQIKREPYGDQMAAVRMCEETRDWFDNEAGSQKRLYSVTLSV
uniref:Uncharacterized protein n=1 Tax=Arion vulgaris TaxID=1028688 RepID=A0A0B7AF12_9EUPU